MKNAFRSLLPFVASCLLLSACVSGRAVRIPGDLVRPERAAASAPGAPRAAVEDFSCVTNSGGVVGRDIDGARPIIWNGDPGKAMADLVAAVLAEKGVATVRRGAQDQGAEAVPVRISGAVRRFEVNTRRTGNLTAVTEVTVALTIIAEGPGLSAPSEKTVTSSTTVSGLYVTLDDLHEALTSTANTVAEEAARALIEAKVVSPSS